MDTIFQTVSGAASTNENGQIVVEKDSIDRWVQLVLDDSNWDLFRVGTRKGASATRAKIPYSGACSFWLKAGQELYVWAKLAAGGAGSTWNLSVVVSDRAG